MRCRSSRRHADPRKRRWLLLRPPDQLDAEERAALELVLAQDPALAMAHALVQRFRALPRARDLDGFHAWLAEARASGLPRFVGVADGLLADRAAVEAAFTEPWSSGAIEGTVHKIKLLKRQAYGRCGLDLLRRRRRAAYAGTRGTTPRRSRRANSRQQRHSARPASPHTCRARAT